MGKNQRDTGANSYTPGTKIIPGRLNHGAKVLPNCGDRLFPMWAALRIHTRFGQAKPFHRPPAYKMLAHNLLRIRALHIPVPHGLWIHHHHRPVLTLVQAA